MITDLETNFVYFSSLLATEAKYQSFWAQVHSILEKEFIEYAFLDNTKNIWCRDYMPIQVTQDLLVQFKYWPSYLDNNRYRNTRTKPSEIRFDWHSPITNSSLIVDGGNVIKGKNKAIVTERLFKENSHLSRVNIEATLKDLFQIEQIYLIPSQPYDYTGHADGMVRFLDEQHLLVNDFSTESISWQKRLSGALAATDLEIITFPYTSLEEKNEAGDYTARGCYINFAQIGNTILFPIFNLPEDEIAIREAEKLFPNCNIHAILANDIAQEGGVLNCLTWNIMT